MVNVCLLRWCFFDADGQMVLSDDGRFFLVVCRCLAQESKLMMKEVPAMTLQLFFFFLFCKALHISWAIII